MVCLFAIPIHQLRESGNYFLIFPAFIFNFANFSPPIFHFAAPGGHNALRCLTYCSPVRLILLRPLFSCASYPPSPLVLLCVLSSFASCSPVRLILLRPLFSFASQPSRFLSSFAHCSPVRLLCVSAFPLLTLPRFSAFPLPTLLRFFCLSASFVASLLLTKGNGIGCAAHARVIGFRWNRIFFCFFCIVNYAILF
mgnify:CR=1 FL=1